MYAKKCLSSFSFRPLLGIVLGLICSPVVMAAEGEPPLEGLYQAVDTVWVLIAAFLVFFMQAGFGMVEAGFIRAKNTCNILTKNFLDFCMASLGFFLVGYALMFGDGNGFIGTKGWLLMGLDETVNGLPLYAFWLFQAAFCGAAATIVAGGMAERMNFRAYLIYSFLISAFIYPLIGHWIWGGGWLSKMGFMDFAGSTVVHTTGGIAALVGTILLKPRLGKYGIDGKPRAIAGHNIPLASLGVFILWFGWFGFNPGSTLGITRGLAATASRVALNTNMAAALGGIAALGMVWMRFGKPDLSMAMNGALAGLVAITAPCAFVEPWAACLIGISAGIIVVLGVELLDKLQIDDPVGAVPVHGICGIWGTLCVGIFGKSSLGLPNEGFIYSGNPMQFGVQMVGSIATIFFVLLTMEIVFKLIDLTIGLRVSRIEELRGLDIGEHGMEAYAGFQVFSTT
ncbi:MAG TPA: ammonium transporter [Anaerohalosphaeraceae bacterium]|nr:ammonium transporter [Anaerohalosphaeraceae bacterium]HOM75948.1 ammonium transporter [Anaerohalosphaeraceae bacterium]HRS70491.1 ammonium transporter [Anaerohalosphaeraceae bacterium]HRV19718.1 ammonium transporter [Anaerohalosphaeraceae bacterium]